MNKNIVTLNNKLIDYNMLSAACMYYSAAGYTQVEVPWMVDEEYSIMTSPTGDKGYAYATENNKHMICSAEQGFLQTAMTSNKIQPTIKYFSVSPCFRNEYDDYLHSKQFMKVELFSKAQSVLDAVLFCSTFLDDAKVLMEQHGVSTTVAQNNDNEFFSEDLVGPHDIELGSYGVRKFNNEYFAYGTGLALPRFSLCQNKGTHGIS